MDKQKAVEMHARLAVYGELKEIIENRIAELAQTARLHEISNAVMTRTLFPPELQELLSFEENENLVIARPTRFLGAAKFAQILTIVKENGGEYVSDGRQSHFRIPRAK